MLTAVRDLNSALRELEPRVALAFQRAVEAVRNQPRLFTDITRLIELGRYSEVEELVGSERFAGALRGEGLRPGTPSVMEELTTALRQGGVTGQRQLGPRGMIMGALDLANPEAARYVSQTLPTLIKEVSDAQRSAVRSALNRGFVEGRPSRLIAREIRDSVGLTDAMEGYVANFRRSLETGRLATNVTPPWERRLSAVERNTARQFFDAARSGTPVPQHQIDRIVQRYHESLVNRRAQNIARTEVTRAHGAGQEALWSQAREAGLLNPAKTRRFWITTPDERLREDHAAVPEMNPNGVGLDEPFETPIGPVMNPRESGDAGFDVNCRCTVALEISDD